MSYIQLLFSIIDALTLKAWGRPRNSVSKWFRSKDIAQKHNLISAWGRPRNSVSKWLRSKDIAQKHNLTSAATGHFVFDLYKNSSRMPSWHPPDSDSGMVRDDESTITVHNDTNTCFFRIPLDYHVRAHERGVRLPCVCMCVIVGVRV